MEYVPFDTRYDAFLELGKTEREALQADYRENNQEWLEVKREELEANYIVVNGRTGEVVRSGDLDDFPENSWLEKFAEDSGDVPIPYVMDFLIEETVA